MEEQQQRAYHAGKLCEIGLEQMQSGMIELAMETFEESIRSCPTADGYTYRAWARSAQGRFNEAIGDCRRAIRLDPDFGNPYNDMGVYLMQLGRLEEAAVWLEQAKSAKRYQSRHFPYLNLGHIYMVRGEQNQAFMEYMKVLEMDPHNPIAKRAISEMELNF